MGDVISLPKTPQDILNENLERDADTVT